MMIALSDLFALSPCLWILAAAFLVLTVSLFRREGNAEVVDAAAYLGLGGALIDCLVRLSHEPEVAFGGSVRMDGMAVLLSTAVVAAAVLTLLASSRSRGIPRGEYYGLLLLGTASMVLLAASADLIMFFLSVELVSIPVYVLSGIMRRDARASEASLKYFIMGAFATGFLLFGAALLFGATGTVSFEEMRTAEGPSASVKVAGLAMLLVGLAFKVGAVPFHMWVPDVYEGAPTAVTAFMSVAVKAVGFGAMCRLLLVALGSQAEHWGPLVYVLAVATMVVGNVLATVQRSVKRMLAYSAIAHTGTALMAVAVSAQSIEAAASAFFYLFVYTFMTFGAFAFLISMGRNGRDAESIEDFAGLAHRRPWAAAAMTLFMVSLAGIPPTAGFFGKFMVFKAAVENGFLALALIGVLTTLISFYYYLRVVVFMYMKEPASDFPTIATGFSLRAAVAVSAILTVALGLMPSTYLRLATDSVRELIR